MPAGSSNATSLCANWMSSGGCSVMPYSLGMQADRRMRRRREAMPVGRLDAARCEQLAHALERVDRVLLGLRGEAVHQIGVHHDAGVGERARHPRHLLDRDALLHELQQPVGRHLETAAHGDAARLGEQLAQLGVKVFSKRMLPHQVMLSLSRDQALRQRAQARGRRGFVDEMEARLAGLRRSARGCAAMTRSVPGSVVAADVVERDVAEGALLPVAAMRQRDLVPAPVRPEPMHRIQHLHERDVLIERQAVVGRGARVLCGNVVLRADRSRARLRRPRARTCARAARHGPQPRQQIQQRALAVVERQVVEVVEDARVAQRAQLGVDPAAAENQLVVSGAAARIACAMRNAP